MANILLVFLIIGVLTAGVIFLLCPCLFKEAKVPQVKDFEWWGRGKAPAGAEKRPLQPKPFQVKVSNEDLDDLKKRLSATRFSEPLEECKFDYGFPSDQLKNVVDYWINKYDWRKEEANINKFPHYKVNIEGIDVHYIHVKPTITKGVKVLPLMMVHGWPGSIVEFLKIIPLLTTPKNGIVFELFCPSIPGYGYSEAPHKKGFNGAEAARIFHKLMTNFHSQYYVQGGDWGSMITQMMAILYPESVKGVHINMPTPKMDAMFALKYIVGSFVPSLIFDKGQKDLIYPFKDLFGRLILESGYMHLQATKPDTAGSAVSDSPAGLAAYIMEKFSSWTDFGNTGIENGALTAKYTLDELLTNVMVYWTTNSITSSFRLYKENFTPKFQNSGFDKAPVKVPTGIAAFPNEIMCWPKSLMTSKYPNIVTFTYMPRGGHFAAFEEPQMLADDILKFVGETEKLEIKK